MIQVRFDAELNAVLIDYAGHVDVPQVERALADLGRVLPQPKAAFRVLVDYSAVDSFDIEVEAWVKKAMRLLGAQGAQEVARVLPDPAMDIGFDILSRAAYPAGVVWFAFRTRREAEEHLRKARVP